VVGDAEQPGAQRRAAGEPGHPFVGLDERHLLRLLRQVGVAEHLPAVAPDRRPVNLHEQAEGSVAVALAQSGQRRGLGSARALPRVGRRRRSDGKDSAVAQGLLAPLGPRFTS
jgi:hypothetical protein